MVVVVVVVVMAAAGRTYRPVPRTGTYSQYSVLILEDALNVYEAAF